MVEFLAKDILNLSYVGVSDCQPQIWIESNRC